MEDNKIDEHIIVNTYFSYLKLGYYSLQRQNLLSNKALTIL